MSPWAIVQGAPRVLVESIPTWISCPRFSCLEELVPFSKQDSRQCHQVCTDQFNVYQTNPISIPGAATLSSCHQLSQGGFVPGLLKGENFGSSIRLSLIFGFLLQGVSLWPLGDVFEQHTTHPFIKTSNFRLCSVFCSKSGWKWKRSLRSAERLFSCHHCSAPPP